MSSNENAPVHHRIHPPTHQTHQTPHLSARVSATYSDVAYAHRDLVRHYRDHGLLTTSTADALFRQVFLRSVRE